MHYICFTEMTPQAFAAWKQKAEKQKPATISLEWIEGTDVGGQKWTTQPGSQDGTSSLNDSIGPVYVRLVDKSGKICKKELHTGLKMQMQLDCLKTVRHL